MEGAIYVTGLIFLCCISYGSSYKECSSTATVDKVKVNGVVNNVTETNPVILKKGEEATLEVDFTPRKPSKTALSTCHGIIRGVKVPFPVTTNGCEGMHPKCPLVADKKETFTVKIDVKELYPSIKLIIQWEEVGDDKKDIFCLYIPAEIK